VSQTVCRSRTVGVSTVDDVRAAGFDVLPGPTRKFPNHGRLVHPDGASGFTNDNLEKLSSVFRNERVLP
jgi:hypothetical protein